MIRACAIIAALMATPAMAQTVTPIPAICANDYSGIVKKYGEMLDVEPLGENEHGVMMAYMRNDKWEFYAMMHPSGVTCVVWALQIGDPA